MGLLPKQIKAKKTKNVGWTKQYAESLQVERSTKHHEKSVREVCNAPANATAKRGVMSNLHKENEETRKAILDKASRVMPLYNKGGLQLLSPNDDLTKIGTQSRKIGRAHV